MIIDQVIASLDPVAGGPTRTVLHLSDALAGLEGPLVRLISQARLGTPVLLPQGFNVECHIGKARSMWRVKLGLPGAGALKRAATHALPHILHSNGIWHPLNHWCACAARRNVVPLVIQSHGMLEPWALDWRANKKRLALLLYQQRDLESAALFVATAEQEAESLRQFGLRQPIAVIPNGIDLQSGKMAGAVEYIPPKPVRHALFLSRIHPVKGLENLLKAWANIRPRGWILQIAGPDEGGHLQEVLALAELLGISDQVKYLGQFDDVAKWAVYRGADLFVLPSFSENFGVVVAEALSQGLPVITTTGTPWENLHTYGCGWWVKPSVAGLKEALTAALALPPGRLVAMGKHGQKYVQRYDWSIIAGQMLDAYRWVLGQGERPTFVRVD